VKGTIIGEIITLKERTSAEDVYADRIHIRGRSRVGNLFGRVIRIESGCDVDSVTYTEELRADGSVRIRGGSQKSEKLPEPPF
jgi:hypothetical protein